MEVSSYAAALALLGASEEVTSLDSELVSCGTMSVLAMELVSGKQAADCLLMAPDPTTRDLATAEWDCHAAVKAECLKKAGKHGILLALSHALTDSLVNTHNVVLLPLQLESEGPSKPPMAQQLETGQQAWMERLPTDLAHWQIHHGLLARLC